MLTEGCLQKGINQVQFAGNGKSFRSVSNIGLRRAVGETREQSPYAQVRISALLGQEPWVELKGLGGRISRERETRAEVRARWSGASVHRDGCEENLEGRPRKGYIAAAYQDYRHHQESHLGHGSMRCGSVREKPIHRIMYARRLDMRWWLVVIVVLLPDFFTVPAQDRQKR